MSHRTIQDEQARLRKKRRKDESVFAIFKKPLHESLTSVLPVMLIVLVLCFTIAPVPNNAMVAFLLGGVMLIVGMGLFTLGSEMSMIPLGQAVGSEITRRRKVWIIAAVGFLIGMIITVAEPDLQVLANQVPAIENNVIIWSVAVGVGVCAVRSDKKAGGDSFGLVALCSIGPIITVLILGLLYKPDGSAYTAAVMPDAKDTVEMFDLYLSEIPHYLKETAAALLPIGAFLILFQLVTRRLKRKEIVHMVIGLVYVYIGLTVFLMGVNVGFMPVGSFLGGSIASHEYNWILVPIAMVIGYFIVQAEPAVHVLNKQVEEITAGAIPAHAMNMALSVGVALSLGLAMIRVLTGISIMWFLIPGYAISLALSFVVPHIFTSVAFDSGGVASGPMTATFLLPFALGACDAVGGNLVTDAFGVVAMVAMTPLVTIQLLGLSYQRKLRRAPAPAAPVAVEELIELC